MKRPLFWILLALVSLLCAGFAARHFNESFSIVNIDLRMDRAAALRAARQLAARHGWGPAGSRQAAAFDLDEALRDFIELEAGGKEVFNRVLQEGLVSPYTWNVRHFREGEPLETNIQFTPQGSACGFQVKLPESLPGNNIPAPQARALAEQEAAAAWSVPVASYTLVEQSSEKQLSGRMDHTFVYELPGISLGAAHYRMRLKVSGDRLTEVARFVKIPESFGLRYQKMRSANTTIASAASAAAGLVYLLGGCVVALLVLLPRRWVQWKMALACGLTVAFLQFLAAVNAAPLDWMSYDTALSRSAYLLQQALGYLEVFIVTGILLTLSFMAAESLTRKAFPDHLQLWRIWSPEAASSPAVAGRTAGGYLLVSVFFAYEVVLFLATRHLPNWWAPSDIVYDPNILATRLPWLTPFATALQAGFWEESLFRAVPLAGAALIGDRLGGRRWWIAGALIVQAVIFAAAHANYPNQPSYARIVEIIPVALGFGFLYLYFGLLPGIVLHFAYDASMMSLPLFVSHAPGSVVDQTVFTLLFFTPVWIVIVARVWTGRWQPAAGNLFNRSWQPAPPKEIPPAAAEAAPVMSTLTRRIFLAVIPAGLVVLIAVTPFSSGVPRLKVSRGRAVALADAELTAARGIRLSGEWKVFAKIVADRPELPALFVWQEGGAQTFDRLLAAGYLPAPAWDVRYARFGGDIPGRSEEYHLLVGNRGVERFYHQLPENRPGPSLDEQQARAAALAAVGAQLKIDPSKLPEISSQPSKLPGRTDWQFEFQDPGRYPLKQGQARVAVSLAGAEVNGLTQRVYVPEKWRRNERDRAAILQVVEGVSRILYTCVFIAGAIAAIVGWIRKRFYPGLFYGSLAALAFLQAAAFANAWPEISFSLSAVEPVANQALTAVGISAVRLIFISAAVALVIAHTAAWLSSFRAEKTVMPAVLAAGWALLYAALLNAAGMPLPAPAPLYPDFTGANDFLPALGAALTALIFFVKRTALLLLLAAAANSFSARWSRRIPATVVLAFLAGFMIAGHSGPDSVAAWIIEGIVTGIALIVGYRFIFRYTYAVLPLAAAVLVILDSLQQLALNAYPGAMAGHIIAILITGALGYFWYKWLERA